MNNYFIHQMNIRTILFLIILFFLVSCSVKNPNHQSSSKYSNSELVNHKTSIAESIRYLDSLVINYSEVSKHMFPNDTLITKDVLLKLRKENFDTLQYYVTLIMTKRFRYHLECCDQGYEIRGENDNKNIGIDTINSPILYEFLLFSNPYKGFGYPIETLLVKRFEYMHSSIILKWLGENRKFLNYPLIKEEYDKIMIRSKYIESDEYLESK